MWEQEKFSLKKTKKSSQRLMWVMICQLFGLNASQVKEVQHVITFKNMTEVFEKFVADLFLGLSF